MYINCYFDPSRNEGQNSSSHLAQLPRASKSSAEMKRKQNHPYKIQVRGPLPADLKERISALHALAILKRLEKAAKDGGHQTQRHDAAPPLRGSDQGSNSDPPDPVE